MVQSADLDLSLNTDGSVYHLNLKPEHLSDVIITVADPHRVFKVSQHFANLDYEMNKGEYITHIGKYKGKRITVISTGMGADNIEVLLNELDYLAFSNKKMVDKTLKIVRIGTCSSIQDIPLGTPIFSNYSIGLDSLMQFYNYNHGNFEKEILEKFCNYINLGLKPYVSSCSFELRDQFAFDMLEGNSLSTPGYYAPQGKKLRLEPKFPNLINDLMYFHFNDFWLTNFETECAPFYALSKLLNHNSISLSVVTENKIRGTMCKEPEHELEKMIVKVLDRI